MKHTDTSLQRPAQDALQVGDLVLFRPTGRAWRQGTVKTVEWTALGLYVEVVYPEPGQGLRVCEWFGQEGERCLLRVGRADATQQTRHSLETRGHQGMSGSQQPGNQVLTFCYTGAGSSTVRKNRPRRQESTVATLVLAKEWR